ncbi:hypothetical protein KAK06_09915 [Ideonella sp. 4Y11]|uniref:Uncharacterized protein n=1 Tax=Ideonella aquatica TaxID=2824119 RepID=A0A941BL33_9BURK|nr:hypothetical protein [Ideonella aquatica]MBQ0959264.1 hypothetical protein [Ideonella aquatica]
MAAPAVRRRLVCYLSGFDPQGPAHYHQLYAQEAARQAAVSGHTLQVGRRQRTGEHVAAWEVDATIEGSAVQTRYEFLRWDDIVRAHWPRSRWALLRTTLWASWQCWRDGVMWYSWRRSWPAFLALAGPGLAMLIWVLLLAVVGAAGAIWWQIGGPVASGVWLLLALPALVALGVEAERRTQMAWLMRSLACLVRQGRGQTPDLEARLDLFAQHLAAALQRSEHDEVLLVGHSSGAMLAVSVAARALARLPVHCGARLSLLTLGNCGATLSQQPAAQSYRDELVAVGSSSAVHWLDVSAPPDGCCYALVDPCEGLSLPPSAPGAKRLNPRFAQLFTPASYERIRHDKYRCHFQYLMASEVVGEYDFFAITAGPRSLQERFAHREGVADFRQFECFGGIRR